MSRIDKLRKQNNEIMENAKVDLQELNKMSCEAERVADTARDVHIIVSDLDKQFQQATGLTKRDIRFLFFATALQVVRQHILTKFPERLSDQEAAEQSFLYHETHSDRIHRYYNPSIEEILSNPVPFDAIIGSDGALAGGGKLGHRVTAIGHDPILGLIFGTANIATATLTNSSLESYHIGTNAGRDFFKARANTALVLIKTKDKLLHEGILGKEKVGLSLLLELAHLSSDIGSKNSLPLPFVSVVNPAMASELAGYGFDMANVLTVGKQAAYATMINSLVAMVHRLYCSDLSDMDRKLYEVRTRKIRMYSNTISTASNVIETGIKAVKATQIPPLAAVEVLRDFDLGGFMVAVYRIINDSNYIKEIKQEFLAKEFYDIVMG